MGAEHLRDDQWPGVLAMKHSQPLSLLCSVATLAGALALGGAALASESLDPHGTWLRAEGGVRFSFYDCGGLLCAKVVGADRAEDRSGIGTVILQGAKKVAANEWKGKLYNADDGKTYDGVITVKSGGELTVKGCIMGILCGGETWKRVGPPAVVAASPRLSHAIPEAAE
jgi:uncharacterized protein (DUF2147 family)